MKLKTHKTTSKKIRVTKSRSRKAKKYLSKTAGQDHFNAREAGKVGRNKRRQQQASKANIKNIKRLIPYS